MSDYSIGDLARHSGVKVPTIRYYEQTGLLPEPPRTEGNQRRYGQGALARLKFIAHARAKAMLRLAGHKDAPCHDLDALVRARLQEVDERIDRLTRLRGELTAMLESHAHGTVRDCRVVEVLSDHGECAAEH